MPIHRESHPTDVDLKPGTTRSDIVVFLYENLEYAYTPKEVAEALDIPEGTASTTIRRLHDEGYLGRMEGGYYHGVDDRDDLRRYPRAVSETEAMFVTHPDSDEAPDPEPERTPDTESVDETTLEDELNDLENDLDV